MGRNQDKKDSFVGVPGDSPGEAPWRSLAIVGHWSSPRALKDNSPGDRLAYLHIKQVRNVMKPVVKGVLQTSVLTGQPHDLPLD
jgi:hypothetical protein